jgi:tetratricopeptide (TPR) repeat protein
MRQIIKIAWLHVIVALFLSSCALRKAAQPAYLEEGLISYEEKKWDVALVKLAEAIRLDPRNVEAHFKKGVILHRQNKTDKAIKSYMETVRYDNNHFKANYNLGNLYSYEKRNPAQATVHYRRFLELAPTHVLAKRTKDRLLELTDTKKVDLADISQRDNPAQFKSLKARLANLKTAYENKDISAIQKNVTMSASRSRFLDQLFQNYSEVKVSLSDPFLNDQTHQSASVILTFIHLADKRGNQVTPANQWKETTMEIRKEGDQWGKLIW